MSTFHRFLTSLLPLSLSVGFTAIAGALFSPISAQFIPSTPLFNRITLSPQFSPDPIIVNGTSGGSLPAATIATVAESPTGFCVGYVDRQPDYRLVLTEPFSYLSLQVRSVGDTVLVVRGPGGNWCNDDLNAQSKNPVISGQWSKGTYDIWVGSAQENAYHSYQLYLTEVR